MGRIARKYVWTEADFWPVAILDGTLRTCGVWTTTLTGHRPCVRWGI